MLEGLVVADLIPHAGRMVLIDEVESCNESEIVCSTRSHLDPGNPLRVGGVVPMACAVEYGAQAMALHGAIREGGRSQPGLLVSVRRVRWGRGSLDQAAAPLRIVARQLRRDAKTLVYRFTVASPAAELAAGQAAVILVQAA